MTTYVIGWPITWPQEAQGWKEGTGTHLEAVNFRMKSQFSFSSAFQRLVPAEERGPILDTIVWTRLMLQSLNKSFLILRMTIEHPYDDIEHLKEKL